MFEFLNFARRRRLSFEQLQTMQMVSQQVVLSLEGSMRIPGAAKKALALELVGELLEKLGIVAPDSLIDTAIEASVRLLKVLDAKANPDPPAPPVPIPEPQEIPLFPKVDVSGRPPTGNSEKGPSL